MPDRATRTSVNRRRRPRKSASAKWWNAFTLFWRLCRLTALSAYYHDVFGNAKGAAYSALFAFFPLLTTTAIILIRFQAQFISDALYHFLSDVLPPGTQKLVFYYFTVQGTQPAFLPITGMAVSVWAGSGLMTTLMQGFHVAYHLPGGRSFVRERLIAILLVFSAAIPVLFASVLIFFGIHTENLIISWLGLLPAGEELQGWVSVLGNLVRYVVSFLAIILGAAILYYLGPNRPLRWRNVWPGAVLATVLWLAATMVFTWYARHIAHYNVMYGSIAAVILLLVWMYVLSVIAFIGCEFNAELERARSAHRQGRRS
jgi:membrane protein